MTAKVLVPLAEGFEEVEAITVIDLLRRAAIDVTSAGLDDGPVRASRGTVVVPDKVGTSIFVPNEASVYVKGTSR